MANLWKMGYGLERCLAKIPSGRIRKSILVGQGWGLKDYVEDNIDSLLLSLYLPVSHCGLFGHGNFETRVGWKGRSTTNSSYDYFSGPSLVAYFTADSIGLSLGLLDCSI
jgi:hypothetical protein